MIYPSTLGLRLPVGLADGVSAPAEGDLDAGVRSCFEAYIAEMEKFLAEKSDQRGF